MSVWGSICRKTVLRVKKKEDKQTVKGKGRQKKQQKEKEKEKEKEKKPKMEKDPNLPKKPATAFFYYLCVFIASFTALLQLSISFEFFLYASLYCMNSYWRTKG